MLQNIIRRVLAYALAVLVGYVAAAVVATQFVLARFPDMGVAVGFGDRLSTTAFDLVGMASTYLPIIAIAFAIAFPVAALVHRWRPEWRWFGYPLAGAVALLVVHVSMTVAFGFTLMAPVRSIAGLLAQGLCGAIGGWVLLRALPRPPAPSV